VAKERLKSPRARLFVALDLPEHVRRGIVEWQRIELIDPALRPIGPQSLHVTLAFLGYLPEKAVAELQDTIAAVAAEAPRLALDAEPAGRPRGRPRIYALAGESPQAVALQSRLESELVSRRLYEPENRPFWPHVTVARVRPEQRGSRRPARVSRSPGPLPEALREPFSAVRITLYRSTLRPQGAEYAPLAQVGLPAT
jgi:RNA 2',3'-cyclic 3'-phosphodiesterase